MANSIYTIGHSTHPFDRFVTLLTQHQIEVLADIRRFPGSRKHPQFNHGNLAAVLPQAGVEYHWMEDLGGRRQKHGTETQNEGLQNKMFRNYADYMLTTEFQNGARNLLDMARPKRTAIMCAEGLFWRCHRRLVSDFLTAKGVTVQHIMPNGELRPHRLTKGAVIQSGRVSYPGDPSLFR